MKVLIVNGSPVKNGATAEIVNILSKTLYESNEIKTVCLGDLKINYCVGCRKCYETTECVITDGAQRLISMIDNSDAVIFVVPSYWADMPGQLKTFIDRCTPYCNTHEPHAKLKSGIKGFGVALRTGSSDGECIHLIDGIAHFYGHMGIEMVNSHYVTGIDVKEDIISIEDELIETFKGWINK